MLDFGNIFDINYLSQLLDLTTTNLHVSSLLQLIKENYTNPDFNVDTLMDGFSLVHSYSSRLFKLHVGVPILEYLILLRLSKFNQLYLEYPDTNLATLCKQAGFPTYDDLRYHISRRYKMNPSKYVESLNKPSQKSKIS